MIAATIISARLAGGGGGGGGPVAPVASFRVSNENPLVGQQVQFTDTSTGTPTSWQWTSNGTIISNEQNPIIVFNTQRVYTILLTVSNAFGSSTSAPEFIAVGTA